MTTNLYHFEIFETETLVELKEALLAKLNAINEELANRASKDNNNGA